MAQIKSVMKAPNTIYPFDYSTIKYPQLASTKFDGFRCLCLCGELWLSPKLKEIRNRNIDTFLIELRDFARDHRWVIDGELWSPIRSFHMEPKEEGLSSIFTTHNRIIPPDCGFYIFDMLYEDDWNNGTEPEFINRYLNYQQLLTGFPHVHPVEQFHIKDSHEAEQFFNNQILSGHEGMILRQLHARYKHGRCTENQDGIWKFKEFETHDAFIIRVEEQMKLKTGVERTRDVLGHLERRFEQDLYEPAGKVGSFVVNWNGNEFKAKPGKGHNDMIKTAWWEDYLQHPQKWNGKHIEFKYMPHGTKDAPRIGSLVRFRPDKD